MNELDNDKNSASEEISFNSAAFWMLLVLFFLFDWGNDCFPIEGGDKQ